MMTNRGRGSQRIGGGDVRSESPASLVCDGDDAPTSRKRRTRRRIEDCLTRPPGKRSKRGGRTEEEDRENAIGTLMMTRNRTPITFEHNISDATLPIGRSSIEDDGGGNGDGLSPVTVDDCVHDFARCDDRDERNSRSESTAQLVIARSDDLAGRLFSEDDVAHCRSRPQSPIAEFVAQTIALYVGKEPEDVLSFELTCKAWRDASRRSRKRAVYVTLEDLVDLSKMGLSLRDEFPLVSVLSVDLDQCPACRESGLPRRREFAIAAARTVLGVAPDAIKIVGSSAGEDGIVSDVCIAAGLRSVSLAEMECANRAIDGGEDMVRFVRRIFGSEGEGEDEEDDRVASENQKTQRTWVKMHSAKKIDISECWSATDADVREILKYHRDVETLSIARCPRLTTESLLVAVASAPKLRTLDASGDDFSRRIELGFDRDVRFGETLLALSLNGCSMDGPSVSAIVGRCVELVVIDASDATDPQPAQVVDAIAALPELRAARLALWLHGSDPVSRMWRAPKLEWLDIGDCVEFGVDGFRRLLESESLKRVVAAGRNDVSIPDAIEALDDAVGRRRARSSSSSNAGRSDCWDFSLVLSANDRRMETMQVLESIASPSASLETGDATTTADALTTPTTVGCSVPSIRIRNDVNEKGQIEVCYEPGSVPEWARLFFELSAAGSFAFGADSANFRDRRTCVRGCKIHRIK